jgi:uncharacterized surface protein with fasciclin (FAS1) repeats
MKKLFALMMVAVVSLTIGAADTKDQTIVEVAVGNKDFSTLVAAVKAAELVDTLSGEGPFTVLAPTNAAFEKLGKETIEAVLKDKKKLTAILTAHVIKGNVMADDVVKLNGKEAETLQGTKFAIKVDGDKVSIGGAAVTKTDIKCKNGVIHVIDTVLMPK